MYIDRLDKSGNLFGIWYQLSNHLKNSTTELIFQLNSRFTSKSPQRAYCPNKYIPCIQDIHSARSVEKFVEIIKSMNFVGVSGRINFPKVNGVHSHSRRSNIKVSSLSLLLKILYAQFYIEWVYLLVSSTFMIVQILVHSLFDLVSL